MIDKLFARAINNYYYLVVLLGLTTMLGFRDWMPIIIIATVYVAVISIKTYRTNALDYIVFLWIGYCIVSSVWAGDLKMVYYGVKSEIIPMLFYLIARGKYATKDQLLENMRIPLLFAFVSALYLFVFPPTWYTAYKTSSLDANASMNAYYEGTRLSGFWPWSYFIGYASLFFIMYHVKRHAVDKRTVPFFTVSIITAILCMFLAQQRASMGFFFVFFIGTIVYLFFTGKTNRSLIYIFVGVIIAGIIKKTI